MFEIWDEYRTIKSSGLFDPVYYLLNSPDVRKADVDPLMHFIKHGWKEGRNPSQYFNTQYYLENNPDVEQSGINPLIHFLRFGMLEGRKPVPLFDAEDTDHLTTLAAQVKAKLAELSQEDSNVEVIEDLLNYPGYEEYEIMPRSVADRKPKVSVCIPVYNGSQYIRDCVNSVLAQSFSDFELVIVNDASTDDSDEIIRSLEDSRIKYFENERNLGLIGNWNKCLELSIGDYVCIFHQDDVMSPNNLEKKVALLESEKQVGLAYSDTIVIDPTGQIVSDHWYELLDPNVDFIKSGRTFFDLMYFNMNLICCPSVVVRRGCYENVGGFDARLPFSGDMEMWMRIALFYDVAYLSEPLIQYRIHESNETQNFLPLIQIHLYLCKRMLLEKYPEQLDHSYNTKLKENTVRKILEKVIFHNDQQEYKIAQQYLFFLEKIRDLPVGAGLNDLDQLKILSF